MTDFRQRVKEAREAQAGALIERVKGWAIKGLAILGGLTLIGIGCGSTYPW